jgi:hypothetical protein
VPPSDAWSIGRRRLCTTSILPIMSARNDAANEIRKTFDTARQVDSNGAIGNVSEADTRAHFIDPLIRALGYRTIADVQRGVEMYRMNAEGQIAEFWALMGDTAAFDEFFS